MLTALRSACREELGGFDESIEYKMPAYSRDGEVEVAFSSRKQYISLHILRGDVMAAHRAELEHRDVGKGCVRFRTAEDVDFELVRSMLRDTAASTGPIC